MFRSIAEVDGVESPNPKRFKSENSIIKPNYFQKLPDELIESIFKIILYDNFEYLEYYNLANVCAKFKNLIGKSLAVTIRVHNIVLSDFFCNNKTACLNFIEKYGNILNSKKLVLPMYNFDYLEFSSIAEKFSKVEKISVYSEIESKTFFKIISEYFPNLNSIYYDPTIQLCWELKTQEIQRVWENWIRQNDRVFSKITEFNASNGWFSNEDIQYIFKSFPNLKMLSLSKDDQITLNIDNSSSIPAMTTLKEIELDGTELNEEGLKALTHLCPNLERLSLLNVDEFNDVSEHAIKLLSKFTQLKSLKMRITTNKDRKLDLINEYFPEDVDVEVV